LTVLVVGTVAFDTIETPFGRAERVLGGSATHFSLAASFFVPVRLVSLVGRDFPKRHLALLRRRGVDLAGLSVADGETFSWSGRYEGDLSVAQTLETRLNAYAGFSPSVPEAWRETRYVFLANGSPESQLAVLEQVRRPALVVADTMNFWIEHAHRPLLQLLRRVHALVLNDEEARRLGESHNLVRAGEKLLALGPRFVVVKKGEHGSFLFGRRERFALPAYPTADVRDPTGAGDSFAGGFLGYLSKAKSLERRSIRRALAYGTVAASIGVEQFGVRGLRAATLAELRRRYREFLRFVSVGPG
jgi:sugar/nucleoside kinase (ribokinase family)